MIITKTIITLDRIRILNGTVVKELKLSDGRWVNAARLAANLPAVI